MSKRKLRKGYKVVCQSNRRLYSASHHLNPEKSIQYLPGKPTRPKPGCGPLSVFHTQAQARLFAHREAHIAKDAKLAVRACQYTPASEEALNAALNDSRWRHYLARQPKGSRLADEVTILPKRSVKPGLERVTKGRTPEGVPVMKQTKKAKATKRKKPVSIHAKKAKANPFADMPLLPLFSTPPPSPPPPSPTEHVVSSVEAYKEKVYASFKRANMPPPSWDTSFGGLDPEWVRNLYKMAFKDGILIRFFLQDLWQRKRWKIEAMWDRKVARPLRKLRELRAKAYHKFFRSAEENRREAEAVESVEEMLKKEREKVEKMVNPGPRE